MVAGGANRHGLGHRARHLRHGDGAGALRPQRQEHGRRHERDRPIPVALDGVRDRRLTIAIGLLGLVEARQGFARASEPEGRSLCAASNDAYEPERRGGSAAAILLNGMLCGLSWDGAPSFAPALAMASWGGALLFVAAYNFSTIVVMSALVSLIGEGTRRSADSTTSTRNLPLRLSLISSLVAVGVGLLWALKGVLAQR